MATVSLPNNPGNTNGNANDFTDVHDNDKAITDQVNGNLENANIDAAAEIDGTKLASSFLDRVGVDGTSTVRRGKSIIATEESTTSTTFTTLTTPDQVQNVVLPTDGLFIVGFTGLWKEAAVTGSEAAIFLGSNQVKAQNNTGAPAVQEAILSASVFNTYVSLATASEGLLTLDPDDGASGSDVTTGQILGPLGASAPGSGGLCAIFAAAGTYTVSIQFKAASGGTITAKERKLWVWTVGF